MRSRSNVGGLGRFWRHGSVKERQKGFMARIPVREATQGPQCEMKERSASNWSSTSSKHVRWVDGMIGRANVNTTSWKKEALESQLEKCVSERSLQALCQVIMLKKYMGCVRNNVYQWHRKSSCISQRSSYARSLDHHRKINWGCMTNVMATCN